MWPSSTMQIVITKTYISIAVLISRWMLARRIGIGFCIELLICCSGCYLLYFNCLIAFCDAHMLTWGTNIMYSYSNTTRHVIFPVCSFLLLYVFIYKHHVQKENKMKLICRYRNSINWKGNKLIFSIETYITVTASVA